MTTAQVNQARIEMRVDRDVKLLAERASVALGCASLTEFLTRLIQEKAPEILEQKATMRLASDQFEQFMDACQRSDIVPSQKIMDAAKRLDEEGY